MIVSVHFFPLAAQLHQLISKCLFVLLVFVGVEFGVRFGIGLCVRVGWMGHEGIWVEGGGLWSPVNWGQHRGSLMAIDAKAALSGDFDQLWGRTGG